MSMTPEQQAKLMDLLDGPGPFDLGVRFERERIIKLLEEAKPLQATDELEWGIEQAIALIKGENK